MSTEAELLAAWRWPNFTADELRCHGSGLLAYDPRFLDRLQQLRTHIALPMTITSGCRSAAHNARVGGNLRSLHIGDAPQHPGQVGSLAVDVATPDGAYRGALFAAAWAHGFSIGWNAKRGFVHLDLRTLVGLPQTTFDY